ncbi:ATP-binding protein [Amycolatopsis eburnea]|uniref:ATP-binding protein n=1 Tax=Amycolatopsis eburnea TaxID=2267691 RepID=A0A3R9DLT7_9PSEU|nr:ATP-binding protein [Amycolatopsis eburnea]RSD20892.1 ATP-binding protein [Amycolatopsis eburnea]
MLARHPSVWLVPRQGAIARASVGGVLDRTTYPRLRDRLLEFAADAGDAVVIDIGGLELRDPALVRVFALTALRVADWPAVPFALVTDRPGQRALAARAGVAVYRDFAAAEASLRRPVRRRAEQVLSRTARTSVRARGFVEGVCAEWLVPGLAENAALIATEFVENTLRHTDSEPRLQVELRRDGLGIAVADGNARPAVLREELDALDAGLGLRMVAKVAKSWGSSRVRSGGKVVWAVLARP